MTVRRFFLCLFAALLVALPTLPFWVPYFIFSPVKLARADPGAWGLAGARFVAINSRDARLGAWWSPPAVAGGPVLLILHGRSGNISGRADIARRLAADGFGLLLVDYRGYGASTGRPSEQGLNEDALAAYDWLRRQGVAPGRLLVIGQSLGNAPAAALAAARPIGALVLVSPFTSLPDAAADRLSFPPLRWLPWSSNRFEVAASLARSKAPLLLIASGSDRLVPIEHSSKLAGLVPGALWIRADNLGHVGMLAGVAADGSLTAALHMLDRKARGTHLAGSR